MLVSYDSAACPSLDDEHFDEQILLDPEILASINASAEALNLRSFSSTSLLGAASNLVSGTATGSAVLADFPDVECEIAPAIMQKVIRPADFDSTSVFGDRESEQVKSPEPSGRLDAFKSVTPGEYTAPEQKKIRSDSPSRLQAAGRTLKEYLDQSSLGMTHGIQQIRSWLHQQQPRVWMFLGDELTGWMRHNGQPGFVEMFRHRLRWELRRFPDLIVNAGVQNSSIDELWKIANQGLMQCHPDVTFILPGKADASLAAKEPHRYAEKLRDLTEFLRLNGTEPVLQTPPLLESVFEEKNDHPMRLLSDLIREVAVVNNIPLIDHAEFWQEQMVRAGWIQSHDKTLTQAGQSVLALLFFVELDIFDRSSELCGKLQDAWNDDPSVQAHGQSQNLLQS